MTVILDVTDMGFGERCDFTVENDFWDDDACRMMVPLLGRLPGTWRFVGPEPSHVPDGVAPSVVIPVSAECDESWCYDEHGMSCFSFCLPVRGDMHSDDGVLALTAGTLRYVEALRTMLHLLSRGLD